MNDIENIKKCEFCMEEIDFKPELFDESVYYFIENVGQVCNVCYSNNCNLNFI